MVGARTLVTVATLLALPAWAAASGHGHGKLPPESPSRKVQSAANAGSDGAATLCKNGAAVQLINYLGGSPDPGGTWSGPTAHPGTFDPATDAPGAYTYTVAGPPIASATVTVTVVAAPNAGTSSSYTACSNDAPFSMRSKLGGTPQPGGTWFPGGSDTFTPGTSLPGIYTYTVPGTPPCANATATLSVAVNAMPSAGGNGTLNTCDNGPVVDLFTKLTGTPDAGGTWTFGGNPVTGQFTPGTSPAGVYTYMVSGAAPCPNASAIVTVTVVPAPNAGGDRSIVICSNDAPFSKRAQLAGTPDPGGTWVPAGGDIFTPGTSAAGVYTYTVAGTTPCANASAQLTITVRDAPMAGTNRSIVVCSDAAVFNLLDSLGGTPDAGGTWNGPGGAHSGHFQPGTDPSGAYVYMVAGQAPCSPASATVTVTVRTAPRAGTSTNVVKCSNNPSFTLFSQLGGTPDAGGTWTGPGNVPFPSGTFVPGTTPPGLYTYTVAGQSPCTPASATVNIAVNTAPNAGLNGAQTVCSSDGAFSLFSKLGGTPNVGGTWTGPGGPVPSGNFIPGTSQPGVYTYRVAGTAPCADATATVTVTVVTAANAGSNGTVTLCSTSPNENLFTRLGGNPDAGGVWTIPPPGSGILAGGIFQPANAAHPSGPYTYTVTGTAPCPNVAAIVQVVKNQAPNAGVDAITTQCSTNPPFSMRSILGGAPDAGGTWLNSANAPVPSQFTPGTTAPGVYRYLLTGIAPCANDTSQVTVNVNTAPNAGTNGAITVCSNAAAVDLFAQLGGSPNSGGTWKDPTNATNNGAFVPGPGALQGGYTYRVAGLSPCADATAVVTVTQYRKPVAGNSASVALCSTDPSVNLFTRLGGTPDAGGTWTGPGGTLSNGVFIPGAAGTFAYKYKVTGTAPCTPDSATVTVTVTKAPDAGTNGTLTICSGQATVDLFTGLGGTPDLNGTWSEITVTGRLSSHFFNPGVPTQLPPGNYDFRYVVPASGSCAADTAKVRVTIVPMLNAGNNGSKTVCSTETQVNLFTALGGNPQQGGLWLDLDATGQVTGQYFNAQGAGAGTFHFRYRLTGVLGCTSDSSAATINVVQGPNAGHEGWATFCSDGPPVALFPYISPANGGGVWRKPAPGNQVFSGTYNPQTFDPGDYTYTVSGTAPCANAVAVLHISETTGPNSGLPAVVTKCANDAAFDMTAALGGSPATNGTWKGPDGLPHTSTFVPGQDAPGVYLYTVAGVFPCVDKTSSLTVNVNPVPQAGGASSKTVCSTASPFLLINELPGAQLGGSWFAPPNMVPFPSGTYIPGTSTPGTYTYRVAGITPCAMAEGTVTVFETPAPRAGRDTSVAFCAGTAAVQLVNLLGGPHDMTGTWTGPAPSTAYFGGSFQPGINTPGVYTYHVAGIPPCASATSTVTATVAQPPSAGLSRSINICSSAGLFAMTDSLGGTPDLNGTWYRLPSGPASNGIFSPSAPGTFSYRYTVQPAGGSPCAPAQAILTINVTAAPNAGGDGNLALCSTSGITALFPKLTGTPQGGGTWSHNGAGHGSTFNPAIDIPGIYAYSVQGTGGCKNDTAVVTVVLNQAPRAGSNGVLTICDDTLAAIVLRNVLNGSPDQGGLWTNTETHLPANDIYLPGNFTAGVHTFTYTVLGTAPCPAATAQATIIQNAHAVAGNNAAITVCTNDGNVNMFALLGPSANPVGGWINAGGTYASATFNPGSQAPGNYQYRYIVAGAAPCVNDTARVSITLNRKPDAGVSTAPQLCASGNMVSLMSLLGGTPDSNGSWAFHPVTGPPVPHDATFNPATDPQGKYVYTVAGTAPCPNSQATVQITVVPGPNAGSFGTTSACVSDHAVNLFASLQGTPQTGGTWADLDATGHLANGVFNATGMAPGAYRFRYTVAGTGPCPSDTASVVVTVVPELNAGEDASATFCLSEVVLLSLHLGGTPQPGGTWTGLESQAGLLNGVLNCAAAGVGVHHYRYKLVGSSSCAPDSATLTVTILAGPQAGSGVPAPICSSTAALDLFTHLSPPYDNNGQWHYPGTGTVMPSSVINPATDPEGTYVYTVPAIGNCPASTASVQVTITQAANAGVNGSLSFCSNGASALLITGLGGTPAPNGSWTFGSPPIPHGPVFNPLQDQGGIYYYTVAGQGPCPSVTTTVLVTKTPAPFAGGDNSYALCSNEGPFNMFDKLAQSPQSGGVWRRAGNPPTVHGAIYNPAVDSSGTFLYIRMGTGPCANDTAALTVTETRAPQAGANASLNVCPSDAAVNLYAALGPNTDPGGTWTDSGNIQLPDSLFNATQVTVGTYVFTYTVPGVLPCANASSTVTVNVGAGLNPGIGGNDTICGALHAYDLFNSLGGTPDPGGVWSEQMGTGAITGHFLNAALLPPGSSYPMAYTLADPFCGQVQTVVHLFISPYPNPGPDTTIALCANGAAINLESLLRGAEPGGTWLAPNGLPASDPFDPAVGPAGTYRYFLPGTTFCADTSARITILVNPPAHAGTNGTQQVCNEGTVQLFPLLGGAPQAGGNWTALTGPAGALANGAVDAAQLVPGNFRYRYRVQVAGCPADSAEVMLTVVDGVAVGNVVRTCNEQDRTYVVSFTITGGSPSSYAVGGGPGTISAHAPYVFTSAPIFTSQPFSFLVDDANHCTPVAVEGTTPCAFADAVFVPESFSPNGDHINDQFTIPGIEGFPNNKIVIFNRWGGEVYKASGYDNVHTVWDGSSPHALIPGEASSGTYYYVLELGNGSEPIKGFVYLNR